VGARGKGAGKGGGWEDDAEDQGLDLGQRGTSC